MSPPAAAAVHTSHSPAAKLPMLYTINWALSCGQAHAWKQLEVPLLLLMPMMQRTMSLTDMLAGV